MFEHNKSYTLSVAKNSDFSQYDYPIKNAIYIGNYSHMGSVSHRFLHIVPNESYIQFAGLWTHMALTRLGKHEDVPGMTAMYTDVYEDIMTKEGDDRITVSYPKLHSTA